MTTKVFIKMAEDIQGGRPPWSIHFQLPHQSSSRTITARKIESELGPIGGVEPLIFATENKSPGMVGQAYRSYLANRIRQGRLDNTFLSIPAKLRPLERTGGAYFMRRNALEEAAQGLLERISRF